MVGLAGVFAHDLVHNADGLEHILLMDGILPKTRRSGIQAIGRTRDGNNAQRLAKPVKVTLLFNAELLARLAAVRLQVLIHARIPYGIGHQMLTPTLADSVIESAKAAFITSHSVALGSAGGMLLILAIGIWFSLAKVKQ